MEDDEDWATEGVCVFKRRRKTKLLVGLDDLLIDKIRDNPELGSKRLKLNVGLSDDEDDEEAREQEAGIAEFIDKCANEVGDGSDMTDVRKWGENVFAAQKEAPRYVLSSDAVNRILAAASASPHLDVDVSTQEAEEKLLSELVLGNWVVLFMRGPEGLSLRRWMFYKMSYTKEKCLEQASCRILCHSPSLAPEKDSNLWPPKYADFMDAFRTYGYTEASSAPPPDHSTKPRDLCSSEQSELPPNIESLLSFLRCCCCCDRRLSEIFSASEARGLLLVLARCLLDRRLLLLSCIIQDCIELLLGYFTDDEWRNEFEQLAASLTRSSREAVNQWRVAKMLRGPPSRVYELQREIAFQLLADVSKNAMSRRAEDVISELQLVDPKAADTDFVQLHYHLDLVDMWLRRDTSFTPAHPAFSIWIAVLRSFSVRISCGDYRTLATKVRNRAAFLMSIYLSRE